MSKTQPKKRTGRPEDPAHLEQNEIKATPKDLPVAILRSPVKKDWRFLKNDETH